MRRLFVIGFVFTATIGFGQVNLDSLWDVWDDESQPDTNRLKAMYNISWYGYLFSQPDSAFYFAQLECDLAKSKGLQKQMASALNTQGVSFYIRGDYASAIDYYTRCLTIREEIGNKKGIATSLNNIGLIYKNQGDYASAIDFHTRSLTIREEIGDKKGIAASLNNIGNIYKQQGDYTKAIDNYTRSLALKEEIGDKKGIASSLGNIGLIYMEQRDYVSAMDYHTRSLTIDEEIGNKKGIATSLNNIGNIYQKQSDYASAIDYYSRGLTIYEEIGDKQGIAASLNNIGNIYQEQGDYASTIAYCTRALTTAQEIGAAIETIGAANALYIAYKATRRHKLALKMYELYMATRDSLNSEENQKEVIRQEYKYEYDKQHLSDSLSFEQQHELDKLVHQAELDKEVNQRYALYGGLGFLLVLGSVAFRGYQRKKKDNILITEQKEEVEKKNREITDSITYAQRIQKAILPPDSVVREYLKESFILYKPKDIVAGDFYWIEHIKDHVLFAAADCTGHGVPAAMVSVVCHNALNNAVREHDLSDPREILEKVNELVTEQFATGENEIMDGMDIALCSLNRATKTLSYAGANNPLWVYRKGVANIEELEETKPDRQPIGKYIEATTFTTHTIQLNKGDSFYIFTDGFPDQFGGPSGKKFKYKPFMQLLLDGLNIPMEEQRKTIDTSFEDWRGELEQVDDVCVIGVSV